jgi:hypothetical protein
MDKKIVSLLNSNLRIIIPEFGAFIIRQQEPKIVVFNELLKNNDCLLIEYIMKTENVEADVAEQLLADFIGLAGRTIESGKVFVIEGIGKLWKDKTGKLLFAQENENLPVEEEVIGQPITRDAVDQQFSEPEVVKSHQLTVPQISNQLVKWILVLVFANLAIVAFFLFKNDVRNAFKKDKNSILVKESVVDQLADSIKAAVADTSLLFSAGPSVPMLEEVITDGDGNLRYYIVAGCFRDEVNADELVTSLKNRGYKAEKFGRIGDLYAVSFASFDNKEFAVKELARIREEFHPDAWMTRF